MYLGGEKMNITLTGNLGSGKGSVSEVFKKWGFGYVSGGDVFRAVAKEKGLTVLEMNELAKKDRSIDDLIDARSTRLGDELDNTLFDSRLAWHFVRESFKVFLLVDTDESARRVFAGNSREMEDYANEEECAEGLGQRANLERERFRKLYSIDYYDMNNYDLVIESTNATPEQIAEEIRRSFEEYKKEKFATRVELNLKAMYPQKDLANADMEKVKAAAAKASDSERQTKASGQDGPAPASTLASSPVRIISRNGYNYIDGDATALMAEAAAGKVFGRVEGFRMDNSAKNAKVPSSENLKELEKAAGFTYRSLPEEKPVKHVYMMDLSC